MSLENHDIGHYHLLKLLGAGGMGEVYLATDKNVKRQVAIKVVRIQTHGQVADKTIAMALKLFHQEAAAIAKMNHPYILVLHEYAQDSIDGTNIAYMVMPYCPEGSLATWLKQRGTAGMLAPKEVVHFVQQAADALQSAHNAKVVHQDVKPDNFLLRTRDQSPLPDLLLADFGVASLLSTSGSVTDTARGTALYMAPEQWRGKPVFATDQYALAVMTYQLLTGQLPFEGPTTSLMYLHAFVEPEPPSKQKLGLSHAIDEVVLRGLKKKPEERYPRIMDFAIALQGAVGQQFSYPMPPAPVKQSGTFGDSSGLVTGLPAGGRPGFSIADSPAARPGPSIPRDGHMDTSSSIVHHNLFDKDRVSIPSIKENEVEDVGRQKRPRTGLLISVAAASLFLLFIGILTIFNATLQGFFVGVAVVWGFALAGIYLLLGRWIGIALTFGQLILLAGIGYNHFGWRPGAGTAAFALLAGFEPVFWILLILETLGVIGLFFYSATR